VVFSQTKRPLLRSDLIKRLDSTSGLSSVASLIQMPRFRCGQVKSSPQGAHSCQESRRGKGNSRSKSGPVQRFGEMSLATSMN